MKIKRVLHVASLFCLTLSLSLVRLPRNVAQASQAKESSTFGKVDVELSEEFQLVPEQSTSAIIVHHHEAKYFSIE